MSIHKRVFALAGALLFLVTSLGLSFMVLWSMHQENRNAKADDKIQSSINQKAKEGKLEGTKLKDFTPISSVGELQKIDTKEGTGAIVKPGDTVTVNYTGATAIDGVIFQSSIDSGKPVAFGLDQVIKGWTDGIPGMKVGGTRRLIIPASSAYGANPPQGSGIPPNSNLVFDVDLLKIGQ